MLVRVFILVIAVVGLRCTAGPPNGLVTEGAVPDKIDFNFHVRPILSDRCFACHGPDENARKADLRLDLQGFAFNLLDSADGTYAIVPGDPSKSQMIHRVSSTDAEVMMPPPESNLKLSNVEIKILTRWVEQGAEWKEHWAFIPPEPVELPNPDNPQWIDNPVDNFILASLERQGLSPSPEASREKLIRRLSFDLRGLPPSLEEIDDFVKDTDPKSYERLVDEFMGSQAYAERLAMEWLDLARYADSHGYQDDLERSQWPWRDWVIKAFSENMPYNDFVTWQLAGDLLPNASYEQKLATGFNRNHKITQEVGVINEEYRVEYVLDRVNTFSTSFLGLTIACAQCHDHKFDPITQKEFYSLFSFFNNVPEQGRVDYGVEVAEPSLPLPEETAKKYTDYIEKLVQGQEKELHDYENRKWVQYTGIDKGIVNEGEFSRAPSPGPVAHYSLDYIDEGTTTGEFGAPRGQLIGAPAPIPGKFSGALEFNGQNAVDLNSPSHLDFRRPLSLSFWLYSIDGGGRGTILSSNRADADWGTGFAVNIFNEYLEFEINRFVANKKNPQKKSLQRMLMLKTRDIIPSNEWVHIALTHTGQGRAKDFTLYRNGEPVELINIKDDNRGLQNPRQVIIGRNDNPDGLRWLTRARIDELLVYNRLMNRQQVVDLSRYNPIAELTAKSDLNDHEAKRLFYHQLHHFDPDHQFLTERLSEYKVREMRMKKVVLNPTMVMDDLDTLRPTYVLERGAYNAPTHQVYPGTPKQVLPFPQDYSADRLGLANWLFNDDNPLTARVAVNRYWQMIFGRGIVATPEDFGSQGDLPSHPGLLDWLALDFRASGWDLNQLIKTMVMSSTYRQTASANPESIRADPENIRLARGPQARLSAEMVRDHALTISGLLSDQVGGPSVKPYQPAGLWLQIASGNQPLKKYIQDHHRDLYRRSMYTFWKRSLPPPSMMAFDASTREQCQVRRQSTSTPMQALVLLNDPQFTEAARLIAQRMLMEGGENAEDRIAFAFRLATSRDPNGQEMELLLSLLQEQQETFQREPQRAANLLEIGEYEGNQSLDATELASYTIIASAIINLTEATQKG